MGTKVTLRHKPITNGRESLYLDFYPPIRCKATMKLVHKEYLGIYIYQNPQNEIQRVYNREMLYKAEAIGEGAVVHQRGVRLFGQAQTQSRLSRFLPKHRPKERPQMADGLQTFRKVLWRQVFVRGGDDRPVPPFPRLPADHTPTQVPQQEDEVQFRRGILLDLSCPAEDRLSRQADPRERQRFSRKDRI